MGQHQTKDALVASAGLGVRDLARDAAWLQLSGRLAQQLASALRRAKARGESPNELHLRLESPEGVAVRSVRLAQPSLSPQAWQAAGLGALRLAWGEVPPGPLRLRVSLSAPKGGGSKVVPIRRHQAKRWPTWRRLWVGAQDGLRVLSQAWAAGR